jgi:hypothetical protein
VVAKQSEGQPEERSVRARAGSAEVPGHGPQRMRRGEGPYGFARAELGASAKRQEVECTVESVPPSNTDAEHRGGLSGLSRRLIMD